VTTSENTPLIESSGNVFEDLGFSKKESENLRIRSELMISIRKRIEELGLTQEEAARRMRVSQPRVSDLFRGKINRFSTDALINMATSLNISIHMTFDKTA